MILFSFFALILWYLFLEPWLLDAGSTNQPSNDDDTSSATEQGDSEEEGVSQQALDPSFENGSEHGGPGIELSLLDMRPEPVPSRAVAFESFEFE